MFFISAVCPDCLFGNCTAVARSSVPKCSCVQGWTGPNCDVPLCNVPCVHGTCIRSNNFNTTTLLYSHTCQCDSGWTGSDCSVGLCINILPVLQCLTFFVSFSQRFARPDVKEALVLFPTRVIVSRNSQDLCAPLAPACTAAPTAQLVCCCRVFMLTDFE